MRAWTVCLCVGSLFAGVVGMTTRAAAEPLVMVSSFAPGEKGGLHAFRLDPSTGGLKKVHSQPGIENPFFFAISPDRKFLYAIDVPKFGGPEPERLAAFRFDANSGALELIGRQTTKGTASCFVDIDPTGSAVLVANYSSGNVISYARKADGSLSEPVSFVQHAGSSVNAARQKEPHAHGFVISPDHKYAYAADLGIDQLVAYTLDVKTATLASNPAQPFVRTPPGAGPRHLIFHPNGKWLYVINELTNSVTRFQYQPEGGLLTERQTISTLPGDFTGTSHTADLKITPNGKFLYGTNRGHDSVAAYRIAETGDLELIEIVPSLGKGPQNLAITKSGGLLLCANMAGDGSVAVFKIGADGRLTSAGAPVDVVSPACIRILE